MCIRDSTNGKIANLAVDSAKIANLAVDTVHIKDAAITTAKIGSLAVDTAQIANGAITNAKIADLSVTNAKIGQAAVGTAEIGNLAVTNAKIADLAVNAAKIQNASITSAKILNLDVDKLTGNTTNFVQSSWNNLSQGVSITAAGLDFTENGTLTSTLDGDGQKFYNGSRYIGRTGITSKLGSPSVQGIAHNLMYQGDFITWGYRASSTDTSSTSLLTLDPKGVFNNAGDKGLIVSTASFFNNNVAIVGAITNTGKADGGNLRIANGATYFDLKFYVGTSAKCEIRFMSDGGIIARNLVTGNFNYLVN